MANTDDLKRGASKSLNLTITEIMQFLKDHAKRPADKLRPYLHRKIAKLGAHWYKRGVRRGHMEVYKEWKKTGRVPITFSFKAEREFYEGQTREVRVTSKIKT